jgi:hypothetical protein
MKPDIGSTAKDTRNGSVGRVMGKVGGYIQLRPLEGGREWDVPPECIESVPVSAALRADLAECNARSRRRF